jgi:hypothetical protein
MLAALDLKGDCLESLDVNFAADLVEIAAH